MSDDTLDIDELDDIEADPELDDEPEEAKPEAAEDRGPGLLSRMGGKVTAPFKRIAWEGFLTIRAAIIAVVVFLLVWLLLVNLAPVRIVLWLWTIDVPKWLAFILDVALGAFLMWLVLWRRSKAAGEEEST